MSENTKAEKLYEMLLSGELFQLAITNGVPEHTPQWFFFDLREILGANKNE